MSLVSGEHEPEKSTRNVLLLWIEILRPLHWVKSGFCLCALLFSGKFIELDSWVELLPLLIGISFLSSSGYLFNDLINAKEDAKHPRKRKRAVASGKLASRKVLVGACVMAVLSLLFLSWAYGVFSKSFFVTNLDEAPRQGAFWFGLIYLSITVLYSLLFRRIPIADVLVLSSGFVVRVAAGAYALGVSPSIWLIVCTYILAMLLGYGKRLGECRYLEEKGRKLGETRSVLKLYKRDFLLLMIVLCAFLAAGAYLSYCLLREDRVSFLWTAIPVIAGLGSYIRLASRSSVAESPEILFLKSPFFLGSIVIWLSMVAFFIQQSS